MPGLSLLMEAQYRGWQFIMGNPFHMYRADAWTSSFYTLRICRVGIRRDNRPPHLLGSANVLLLCAALTYGHHNWSAVLKILVRDDHRTNVGDD